MASTARREPRRVRSARRRAAHHADRTRKAASPAEHYRAAELALASSVAHARGSARIVRSLREDVVSHVRRVLDRAQPNEASAALYEQKLAAGGRDVQRLATAIACLRAAIHLLPDTERDRLFEHYAQHFGEEIRRLQAEGK